jgi:cell division protein FtsB
MQPVEFFEVIGHHPGLDVSTAFGCRPCSFWRRRPKNCSAIMSPPAELPAVPRNPALHRSRRFERTGSRQGGHRLLRLLIVAVTSVLVVDALFGERGWLDSLRARRQHAELAAHVERLRRETAQLRAQARRLREEPDAIEEAARQRLGLIRPGELVVIVRDRTGEAR